MAHRSQNPRGMGSRQGKEISGGGLKHKAPQPSQPMLIHPKPQTQGFLALLKGRLSLCLHPKSNLHSNINKMLCWGKKEVTTKIFRDEMKTLNKKVVRRSLVFLRQKTGWASL